MDYSDPFEGTFGSPKIKVNKISNHSLDALKDQLGLLGLDLDRLKWHESCLNHALKSSSRPLFQIVDTCRMDNGGVLTAPLPSETEEDSSQSAEGFVAFVPAAGAASRYVQPFLALSQALEHGELQEVEECLEELRRVGAENWPLPRPLASLLRLKAQPVSLTPEEAKELACALHLPKALMPCVMEGDSFLSLKLAEHRALKGLSGQVYIAPPDMRPRFESLIEQDRKAPVLGQKVRPLSPSTHIISQGPSLSTIRFNRDGTPFLGPDGQCSLVPAGHGALIEILPEVAKIFPEAHSVFIRNIDNVIGTKNAAHAATFGFLSLHDKILRAVKKIREALAEEDLSAAVEAAQPLRDLMDRQEPMSAFSVEKTQVAKVESSEERILWEIQTGFFHSPLPKALTLKELRKIYERPVNTLGQVPNTGKDVGGTPCFVRFGETAVKICIELPHVSDEDKGSFLTNPSKATHFNPVFAAAELIDEDRLPELRNHGFWILSEKTHKGHPVVYFETVLYELLGNSYLANCTFVEVPRIVFNPHKSVNDAAGRSLKDWLAGD